MKGRARFAAQEAAEIRRLLGLVRRADPGPPQKRLRDQLRALGFYITDWAGGPGGFTSSDFDDLVARGLVKVEPKRARPAVAEASPLQRRATRHHGRPADRSTASTPATSPSSGALADEALVGNAMKSLSTQPMSIAAAFDGGVPNAPGLYAIYEHAAVWQQLGLSAPSDDRPLYVGKAEASLRSRDLSTHFATGRTGQSSPRRSFAALLVAAGTLELSPCPRRLQNPEARKWTHYALEPACDEQLTAWMCEHLAIVVWVAPRGAVLAPVESRVMNHWLPPLNLIGVSTPWTAQVKSARAVMAERARTWARERGFSG